MEGSERFDGNYDCQDMKNHGMDDCALRTRSSVVHRLWRDHISDKNGRRDDFPPNAMAGLAVPKATFLCAMTVMDKGGRDGMKNSGWGQNLLRACGYAHKAVMCGGRGRPPQSRFEANAQDHHGMCEMGD